MLRKITVAAVIVCHLLMVFQILPSSAQEEQETERSDVEELEILHEPITEVVDQQAIHITAELMGPVAGKLLYLMYRKIGKKNFQSKSMKKTGTKTFSGEIPAKMVTVEGLEYYLRVLDTVGRQLIRYPHDETYVSVSVKMPEPEPEVAVPEAPPPPVVEEEPPAVPIETEPAVPETEETVTPEIPARPEALKIVHEPVIESTEKQAVAVTAALTRPVAGKLVYVMYRKMGQKDFSSKSMMELGDNEFSGEIPAKQITSEGLEYYLRVSDTIGNQLARYPEDESYIAVSVSPAERVVEVSLPEEPVPPVTEEKPPIVLEEAKKDGIKWHWIGLGALAVGGIAAFALSGDGKGGEGQPPAPTKLPDPPDRP
jgi:hypothetical protein